MELLQHNVTESLDLFLCSTVACRGQRANLLSGLSSLVNKGILGLELVDLLSRITEDVSSQVLRQRDSPLVLILGAFATR